MLDHDQLLSLIKKQIREAGSQKALAYRWGISQQHLSDVLTRRRMPNKKMLDALGYDEVTMYKRIYHRSDQSDEQEAGSQTDPRDRQERREAQHRIERIV